MKNIILLFIFLIPAFLFAQYPATGNKQRLGYQTTGDGLIWRGVAADTAIKPRTINNAYFQLDTVNGVLRRYIATRGSWQTVSGGGGGGGLTMPFDSIYFNPTTADPDTAELKYNADLETFVFGADGTIIEIGQKSAWYVKNQTGSTITKGTVVRASGTLGSSGRILISPMVIDGTVDSKYLLGITASDIADGSDGYVIHFGKLRKFNTSAWSDGDVLYAGTGGTLTATEPSPPNLRLPIAFVVHSHATNGILAIRIQTGNELHELHDVDTTGIDNGGVIVWNAASDKWEASNGAALTTADTTSRLATKYWTNSNFFPLQGGTLTGTGGAGLIGFPSQVSAPGTPASGLNVYAQGSSFNWKGTDGYERQFASTLTGGRTYTLPDVSGTFALGTGTADRSARWSATNTLAAGNFTDNGTKLESLLPHQLALYTTATLPTGVKRYMLWDDTKLGIGWYNGTRWAYALESTFATGTSGRYPRFDANGQITNGLLSESSNVVSVTSNNLFQFGKWANTGARPTLGEAQVGYNQATKSFEYSDGSTVYNLGFWVPSSSDIYFLQKVGIGTSTMTGQLNISATGGTNSLLRILSTSAASLATTEWYNSSSDVMQAYVAGSSFSSGAFTARSAGVSYSGTGGYNIMAYGSGAPIRFITGGVATTNERFNISSVGTLTQLNTTTGLFLASGTTAQTPTEAGGLIRFNSDSTLYQIYSGGTRSYIATRAYARSLVNATTWLKPELTAGRDVDITGGSSTDFRIRSNTRTQFDGIFKVGADSIMRVKGTGLVKNPGSTLLSNTFFGGGALELRQQVSSFQPIFTMELDSNRNRSFIAFRKYNGNSVNILTASDGTNDRGALVFESQLRSDDANTAGFSFNTSIIDASNTQSQPANADFVRFFTYSSFQMAAQQANGNWYYGTDKHTIISPSGDSIYHYGNLKLGAHGVGGKTATALSKTQSGYIASFATDGTVLDLERKRDTTIYVTDADYDFSAALTTAQIASRYNRVIFWMTTTGSAGSDSEITLHTPDANLMQVEYLIHSVDEAGGFANVIRFGTNNAVDSTNGLVSSYFPAAGDGVHIRAGLRSGVYKYRYSN